MGVPLLENKKGVLVLVVCLFVRVLILCVVSLLHILPHVHVMFLKDIGAILPNAHFVFFDRY